MIVLGAYAFSTVAITCLIFSCFYAAGVSAVRLELEEIRDEESPITDHTVEMQLAAVQTANDNPPSYEEAISKSP